MKTIFNILLIFVCSGLYGQQFIEADVIIGKDSVSTPILIAGRVNIDSIIIKDSTIKEVYQGVIPDTTEVSRMIENKTGFNELIIRDTLIIDLIRKHGMEIYDLKFFKIEEIENAGIRSTSEDILMHRAPTLFISYRGNPSAPDGSIAWYNVFDPQNITFIDYYYDSNLEGAMLHKLIGDRLYFMSLGGAELYSVDISNLNSPYLLDTVKVNTTDANPLTYKLDFDKTGRYCYTACRGDWDGDSYNSYIYTIDVSDSSDMKVIDTINVNDYWLYGVFRTGDYLYVSGYDSNDSTGIVKKYSLSNPAEPSASTDLTETDLNVVDFKTADTLVFMCNWYPPRIKVYAKDIDGNLTFSHNIIPAYSTGKINRISIDYKNRLIATANFYDNTVLVIQMDESWTNKISETLVEDANFSTVQSVYMYDSQFLFVGSRNFGITIFQYSIK